MNKEKFSFKIGDRVVATEDGWADQKAGDTGTVLDVDDTLAVRWDRDVGGHDCAMPSECTCWYGTFIHPQKVVLLEDDTIMPSALEVVL